MRWALPAFALLAACSAVHSSAWLSPENQRREIHSALVVPLENLTPMPDAGPMVTELLSSQLSTRGLTVIERAREVLKLHEGAETVVTEELAKPEHSAPVQIQMFEPVGYGIAERIRALNLDKLRPIEALQLLSELQRELRRQ